MDGFARRKEQSKEDIRNAAWELFSQFGVDKASIADIARKAGVSQATIYNNFGSKEVLAREFVSASVEHLMSSVQEILTHKRSYNDKMAAFFQFISDMLTSGRPAGSENAVFTSSLDLLHDPEIKKIRTQAQKKMTELLLQLIEEGKQQGQVNPDLSEEALHVYFAVFMDVFTNPELQRQFYKRPAIIQEVGALMLYGLKGQHK